MAFSPKSCRRLDSQTPVGNAAGVATAAQINKYVYATQDAPAVVEAAGYFNALRDSGSITIGSTIDASMSLGGTPVAKTYVATVVPATGNVVVVLQAVT